MRPGICLLASLVLNFICPLHSRGQGATSLPENVSQLIVTTSEGWNNHHGKMHLFERANSGGAWRLSSGAPTAVLLGRNGLAWGRGILPVPHGQAGIPTKTEKDGRTPAGCFKIGMAFGYASRLPQGSAFPYYQVTARDCWVDDPQHPAYNQHIVVDPKSPPPWYAKQRMRLGDFAYEWKLEIRHNVSPPVPGAGSAIFFHVRRGPNSPTSGCTTMSKENLLQLLAWLHPNKHPHYVVLPKAEYQVRVKAWNLPALTLP